MRRAEKAERIMKVLHELYPNPEIPLDHRDPYTLIVAVVLSAQTTDKKVNQVTPRLFEEAPDVYALAEMRVEDIRHLIREVGLAPQKAKALSGLAQKLISDHDGKVPSEYAQLIELPGVGNKTANVVISQVFGRPAFPVDTHIHRLAYRWGLSKGRTADHTEEDLKRIFPENSWNRLHLQIIYFGREYCPALRHDFEKCPICSWAAAKNLIAESHAANLDSANRRAVRPRGSRNGGSRAAKR
jgi:endonuclease-3